MPNTEAEQERAGHLAEVRRTNTVVRQIEERLAAAVEHRDRVMLGAHGLPRDGKLTYNEMAGDDASGYSRSRVIQIVQGARAKAEAAAS